MERDRQGHGPLLSIIESQGVVILDGGLATELEVRGCDLSDELWSAGVLIDRPDLIREVHRSYLEAGADCIASASYQATIQGFARRGLTDGEAESLLRRSVALACAARDEFWEGSGQRTDRQRPVVAASVGPYGAYLADGSEFRGDYGLSESELLAFHLRRWQVLATSGADLLACETLPSAPEAKALRRLLEQTPDTLAWFSFSCRSGSRISDGTPIVELAGDLEDCEQIVAIGVNCTAPTHIEGLVRRLVQVTGKPIVVYPNSGEGWDAVGREWTAAPANAASLASAAPVWVEAGAKAVGGCCRTGPADIRQLRRALLSDE